MKKKLLNALLSLVFMVSIIASAVMIFPQNAKSEGEPGNSLDPNPKKFHVVWQDCANGPPVIRCVWDDPQYNPNDECWPQWQDFCDQN